MWPVSSPGASASCGLRPCPRPRPRPPADRSQLPLLSGLDSRTQYLVSSKMVPFRRGPGHDLASEGDAADRFWVLVEGEVVALYHFSEAEHLLAPCIVGESGE